MADDTPPRRKTPVPPWKSMDLGIDDDHWLKSYRRAARPHESAAHALAYYQRLFNDSPAAIVIVTPDFTVTDANVAAQQLLKKNLSQLRDTQFHRHVSVTDQQAFVSIRRDILEHPVLLTRPLSLRRANDAEVEVSITTSVFRDEHDQPEFILMMILERGKGVSEDML